MGGETGLMGSLSFASGERAMTGDTGALTWSVDVSELMRCIEGTQPGSITWEGVGAAGSAGTGSSSPGMVTFKRSFSFAFAARKSVL